MKKLTYALLIPLIIVSFHCKKKEAKPILRQGLVNFTIGTVSLISRDGKKAAARVGDVIEEGMKIETGDKSHIDIYFDEDAIRVLEKSSVEVKALQLSAAGTDKKTELYVHQGRLFSRVTKKLAKGSSYRVKTPTTIAGVRGTEFLVTEEDGKGNVACLKGKIVVKNEASPDKEEVEVKDEQEVDIEKDKKMSVKDLSEENKKQLENIINNFQEQKKSIREIFEKQREEIRQKVIDQKKSNKELIEKQKAEDKQRVEDQKEKDKANVDAIKGKSTSEGSDKAKEDMSKGVDKAKEDMEKLNPLEKFKKEVQ